MLPAWVGKSKAPPIRYQFADSVRTAPGWRKIRRDFYTCVPPAEYPPDPAMVRELRSFDPTAILIWRKQFYLPPNSTDQVLFVHNGLARYVPHPRAEKRLFYVEMPPNAKHPRPNEITFIWEKVDDRLMYGGGPGGYMPWDRRIVNYLKKDHNLLKSSKTLWADVERREAEKEASERRAQIDFLLDWLEFQKWCDKKLDTPGDNERALREYRSLPRRTKPHFFMQGAQHVRSRTSVR